MKLPVSLVVAAAQPALIRPFRAHDGGTKGRALLLRLEVSRSQFRRMCRSGTGSLYGTADALAVLRASTAASDRSGKGFDLGVVGQK